MRIEDLNLPSDVVELIRKSTQGDEVAAAALPHALLQLDSARQAELFRRRLTSWLQYALRSDEDGGAVRYAETDDGGAEDAEGSGVLKVTPDTCEPLDDLEFASLSMDGDGIVIKLPRRGIFEFYVRFAVQASRVE